MKNTKLWIVGSLGMLILSGCSSKYPVTFDSNPKGAVVVCSGKNWGYTPKTLYFDERVKQLNSLDISSCSANWVSGYSKNYGTIPVRQFPNGVRLTLERPFGDGYEKDAQFALQIQNMEYQQRQAKAAEANARANREAADDAFYQNLQRNNQLQNINNYLRYGY